MWSQNSDDCGLKRLVLWVATANLSQQFALVCSELDVPYLDVFSILVKSPLWLTEAKANDGAHPRATGYAEFAAIVQSWEGWLNWFMS